MNAHTQCSDNMWCCSGNRGQEKRTTNEQGTNLPSRHNARPEKWGSNEDKYTWYSVREISHTRKVEHKAMLKHVNAQTFFAFQTSPNIMTIARNTVISMYDAQSHTTITTIDFTLTQGVKTPKLTISHARHTPGGLRNAPGQPPVEDSPAEPARGV